MMQAFVTYVFSSKDDQPPSIMAVWKGTLNKTTNADIREAITKQRPSQKNIKLLTTEFNEIVTSANIRNN